MDQYVGPQLIVVSRSQIAAARALVESNVDRERAWWVPTVKAGRVVEARLAAEGITSTIVQAHKLGNLPELERYQRHD